MEKEVPEILINPQNSDVLNFLKHRSCHGDIIQPLELLLSKYSDVTLFCPNGSEFKYVFWYVGNTVFAYAQGMKQVTLRLPKPNSKDLKVKGEFEGVFNNETWWSYKYNYRSLNKWADTAYKYAKNS